MANEFYDSRHTGKEIDDAVANIVDGTVSGLVSEAKKARDESVIAKDASVSAKTEAVKAMESAASQATEATRQAGLANTSASLAESAKADAAQSATFASNHAKEAAKQVGVARNHAYTSQSYAVGGTGFRPGENTDNAKYYSQQATTSASNADINATEASRRASEANDYALKAEAFGYKAYTHSVEAQTAAQESKSWAVGGTGTRPEEDKNNAKYWAEQAAGTVSGVASFNGRHGIVVPQAGDYTAEQVGALSKPTNTGTKGKVLRATDNGSEWSTQVKYVTRWKDNRLHYYNPTDNTVLQPTITTEDIISDIVNGIDVKFVAGGELYSMCYFEPPQNIEEFPKVIFFSVTKNVTMPRYHLSLIIIEYDGSIEIKDMEFLPFGGSGGQVPTRQSDGSIKWENPKGGVTSFNGRAGAVTPQNGDYNAEQVGAIPSSGGVAGQVPTKQQDGSIKWETPVSYVAEYTPGVPRWYDIATGEFLSGAVTSLTIYNKVISGVTVKFYYNKFGTIHDFDIVSEDKAVIELVDMHTKEGKTVTPAGTLVTFASSSVPTISGAPNKSFLTHNGDKMVWKELYEASNIDIGVNSPLESGKLYFVYEL